MVSSDYYIPNFFTPPSLDFILIIDNDKKRRHCCLLIITLYELIRIDCFCWLERHGVIASYPSHGERIAGWWRHGRHTDILVAAIGLTIAIIHL